MNELLYRTLTTYFGSLSRKGYIKDITIYKLLILDFIQYMLETEDISQFILAEDVILIETVIRKFYRTTCEVQLPNQCLECH